MYDPRIRQIAQVLVQYSLEVKPEWNVLIRTSPAGEPLAREVYREALRAGAYPVVSIGLSDEEEIFYKEASEEQLRHEPLLRRWVTETFDAIVTILAETNTKRLMHVDPKRISIARQAQGEILRRFLERAARGELHWVLTLFPTNAYAQDANMSLAEFSEFVFGAALPDPQDPIGYWRRVSAYQARIVDWLSRKDEIHVIAPGTDLRLRVGGRTWISADGKENFPDGEVFTAPIEDSVEGHITFSYPAVYNGREVEGVELWFERGRVVRASARRGEDFLLSMLDTDEGARRVGEFAIGLNRGIQTFTKNILFDEKIHGTIHMALGKAYPECGGKNESAIHWDMICDLRPGGKMYADGELFYENGEFVVEELRRTE